MNVIPTQKIHLSLSLTEVSVLSFCFLLQIWQFISLHQKDCSFSTLISGAQYLPCSRCNFAPKIMYSLLVNFLKLHWAWPIWPWSKYGKIGHKCSDCSQDSRDMKGSRFSHSSKTSYLLNLKLPYLQGIYFVEIDKLLSHPRCIPTTGQYGTLS